MEGILKGYHLSMEGIRKGCLFCQKWYIKGQGLELGAVVEVGVRDVGAEGFSVYIWRPDGRHHI